MTANVTPLRDGKHFALEAEISDRLWNLIMEYEGRVSLVATLGVLDIVKHGLLTGEKP